MDSVCYALFGEWQMDHIVFGVFLALYAVVRSRYDFRVCLVRGWMFMASTMVMLPISEPLGRMFAAINQAYYAWAQYLTPVVVAAMIFAEVWFLLHSIRGMRRREIGVDAVCDFGHHHRHRGLCGADRLHPVRRQGAGRHPEARHPGAPPPAFRDEDICSLLSNLLDNAMEAAAQSGMENPEVEISILPRQDDLFIRVVNPVDKSIPEKRRMTLGTTKTKHTELHGFGTRIIRRIAQSYHGSVKYSMSEGVFTTDVMLEMPEEEQA